MKSSRRFAVAVMGSFSITIVISPSLKIRYAAVEGMDGVSEAMHCRVGDVGLCNFLRMIDAMEGRRPRRTKSCEL